MVSDTGGMEESPQDTNGLTSERAARLLEERGPNEIAHQQTRSLWKLLFAQFNSPVIWLLLAACVVSGVLGELADAFAIGAIVVLNAAVGFFQEFRAEQTINALRSMTAPRARVIRDGRAQLVAAATVVLGDLLEIEAGDIVAADARLVDANVLSANEAALTGESAPVPKHLSPSAPNAPLAERHDCVFLGTTIAAGTGRARVTATGMQTELGRIAHLLTTAQEEVTPLQQRLASLSRLLMYLCVGVVAVVALLGWWRGLPPIDILLSGVSLAVAVVPEGLPAVVTIALAVGMRRMAARQALLRRLMAVETLGCATVICTDKTGTLTTGVMTVREVWGKDTRRILEVATACSDAQLDGSGSGGIGDPTEVAILAAALAQGIHRESIEQARPRRHVNPFDADRKRMSIYRADGVLYAKGGVESISQCSKSIPEGLLEAASDMASRGLRVLAVALGADQQERGLEALGLVGIADPPRREVIGAIATASAAGIRTVMITGDHPLTAHAIARELGILGPGESPEGVVHARATPEDKLTIVRNWKQRGAIVAMTGDGVNDAPALREAHIGIAMGKTGTEVTREASDIVLADDNFATIVAAVEEGRGIFENIRKTTVYLLAGNVAELAVVFLAALVGLPAPLLPLQLLWINLVTDGVPALALVTDARSDSAMTKPPRPADEPIVGRRQWRDILLAGALQTVSTLSVFLWALEYRNLEEARNLAFSVLVFGELLRAFSARDPDKTIWEVGVLKNRRLLLIVLASMLVQLGIHHVPALQSLFEIGSLSELDCAVSLAAGAVPLVGLEFAKLIRRQRRLHAVTQKRAFSGQ